jgi:hypothetical protein
MFFGILFNDAVINIIESSDVVNPERCGNELSCPNLRHCSRSFFLTEKYNKYSFAVVLYGRETWSLTLREEHRLRVFEDRVLRRIFGPNRNEVV